MNKVIIMGRLTADPELKQTTSGIASCRFTVAVNRKFADKNAGERQADFISCTAWRQTAEFVSRYFRKGSMICVEGTLRTGSYADRNHPDVTHYTTDVLVDNVEFTGSKNENSSLTSETKQTVQSQKQQVPSLSQDEEFCDLSGFEEIIAGNDVPF